MIEHFRSDSVAWDAMLNTLNFEMSSEIDKD